MTTLSGFKWELLEQDKWLDTQSQLVWWLPNENDESECLPTKEQLIQAERHGIREVLSLGEKFYSSSTPCNYSPNFVFFYYSGSGVVGNCSRNFNNSVLYVRNINKEYV